MTMLTKLTSLALVSFALVGCRTSSGSGSELESLVDARVLSKSQVNSDYWYVECENGISETHTTAEVRAEQLCESLPVYQFFNPDRHEAQYTTSEQAGPNYGLRGVRFNILPYPMTNEDGQPITQRLTQCFDRAERDYFLSVGNCNSPHEEGEVVRHLGYVLKPNQAVVGATMPLIRCVREARPNLRKDTKYSHDGATCQGEYRQVGSPLGIVLRPFPTQLSPLD